MKKTEELRLYIPKFEELDFYQSLLSDPDTMFYNAPWFPPNGCVEFPREKWEKWYENWINQEPNRFYAYLQRTSDNAFVGDVNFHYNKIDDWWDMGIVILAKERGKGYSKQGLKLLLERAFEVNGISLLHNSFEVTREAAYHIHKMYGFKEGNLEDGIIHLFLSKEEYLTESRSR
ncbi:MAG: GNAT family N-acetyltransferase [Acholeplasmataceae bacterium]